MILAFLNHLFSVNCYYQKEAVDKETVGNGENPEKESNHNNLS